MSKKSAYLVLAGFVVVVLLPFLTYALAYGLTRMAAISELGTVAQGAFVLGMILLLLVVPYWMLKVAAHAAHKVNRREPELHLKDIPKDQEQLKR